MSNHKSNFYYLPIVASIFTVIGLLLGKYLYQEGSLVSFSENNGKVEEVISTVVERYVDTVNQEEITDHAIVSLLEHLDPHSTYLPASKVPKAKEQMRGNFVGIGIEFRIIDDTLVVVSPVRNGPSEKAGMLSGDRLIGLNGEEIAFGKLSTDSLVSLLRGEAGSYLSILLYRPFSKTKITVNLTRKEIPIFSIDASFLLNDSTAFVKINRFSQKTHHELKEAIHQLVKTGANNLIIDVRGNPGGLLGSVKSICNEFLSKGDTILSTKRQGDIDMSIADGNGEFKEIPIVIIIDRNSASASEILAGTLQDNDRAKIVGRRSFGKGLVQAVIPLKDKSRINVTIAKYYLPSGRCIQKPYKKDQLHKYRMERDGRIESGELYNKELINLPDSLRFYTKSGRMVYAQNGIIPDIFVPFDTTFSTKLLLHLRNQGIIRDVVVKYYYPQLLTEDSPESCFNIINDDKLIETLVLYSRTKNIEWNPEEWETSKPYILNKIKAYIIRMKFGNNGYFKISSSLDKDILKAQQEFLKVD
jgi:carboxyl-terminal processing protease